jgi:hypothetical protein
MQKATIVAGALALLLLGGIVPPPGALAGSQRPHLWWAHTVTQERLDLGEQGLSIGDQYIWHDLIGESRIETKRYPTAEMSTICTVVHVTQILYPPMACEVVIHFIERGVIVSENCCWSIRGLWREPPPFKVTLPITGGARMLEQGRGGKIIFIWKSEEWATFRLNLA